MRRRCGRRMAVVVGALAVSVATAFLGLARADGPGEVDVLRRLGKACYENDDFKAAAEHYRQVVMRTPASAPDFFNLGLVLMRAADYTNALAALDRAGRLDAKLLAVAYVRGIIFKRQGEFPKAIESLKRVVAEDPACVGALYNLAMCEKAAEQHTNAIATLLQASRLEPNNPNCHYQLITLYRRVGNVEGAARHAEIYERVKDALDESEKTVEALERSRYAYIIPVPPAVADRLAELASLPRFTDVTRESGFTPTQPVPLPPPPLPARITRDGFSGADVARRHAVWNGGAIVLGDYDGDGWLDVYVVNCSTNEEASANRLLHNERGGRFSDATAKSGTGDRGLGMHALFGDYDNDGRLDLYVVNQGPNVLYRNRGDGSFEDVSVKARADEPQYGSRAAFVDYDHDNDLDLMIVNNVDLTEAPKEDAWRLPEDFPGQANTLLRNNGDGTFTDQTDEAGLLVDASQTRDLVFADFDSDGDTDMLFINFNSPSQLFLNARMGKFVAGGSFDPPLGKGATAAAGADLNRDGHADLILAAEGRLALYTNDGRANFKLSSTIQVSPGGPAGAAGQGSVSRLVVFDFNNDAWPDLLVIPGGVPGLRLLAGTGRSQFRDVTEETGLAGIPALVADAAAGDLDQDGDLDLVLQTRDRGQMLWRNECSRRPHWLAVKLAGKKVNRRGIGASLEIAGPGLYHQQTVREAVTHFGLGSTTNVDLLRITWPNGVAQNVIRPALDRVLEVEEYVKVSASCAFLWADAGRGFKLINEVLGIGPLGVSMTATQYFPLDCTELTKIEPDQLRARDGFYELRLTEDLRELAYVDQVELRVVDHPGSLEIVPNEMFIGPPFPEDRFFAVPEKILPRSAVDDRGSNVLELILRRDGRYPTFPLTRFDGLACPHSLTLDLGDLSAAAQILLHLDGWIYWADSSVSWGLFQNPACQIAPLKIEARDAAGRWVTIIESAGLPTSKGMVVPVDLTGKFPAKDWHVRLSTTLCVYFDRIFVSTRDEAQQCRVTRLPAVRADLHFRGFARMTRDALGYERFDYDTVSPTGSWNPPRGRLTRYGNVTPLLAAPDDMFVTIAPGEEMAMRFAADRLAPLPAGWSRSFIFYANGWVKDGDLNTKHSETVEPLPFHAMSGYPYPANEQYPDDAAHRDYLRAWQTRTSHPTVGDLRAVASDQRLESPAYLEGHDDLKQ